MKKLEFLSNVKGVKGEEREQQMQIFLEEYVGSLKDNHRQLLAAAAMRGVERLR